MAISGQRTPGVRRPGSIGRLWVRRVYKSGCSDQSVGSGLFIGGKRPLLRNGYLRGLSISLSKRIHSIRALTTVWGSASWLFKGGIRSANCGCRIKFPRKAREKIEYISFNKHFNSLCRPLNLIPSLRCLFAPPRKPLSKLYLSKSYLVISLRMMKSFVKILHRLFACRLIVFRMPYATTHIVDLFPDSEYDTFLVSLYFSLLIPPSLKQRVPTHLSLPHP